MPGDVFRSPHETCAVCWIEQGRYEGDHQDVISGGFSSDLKYDFGVGQSRPSKSTAHPWSVARCHSARGGKGDGTFHRSASMTTAPRIRCSLAATWLGRGSGARPSIHFCTSIFWYFSQWYTVW